MNQQQVKVLFLAGSMRSGSTLLGMIFDCIPEFVNVGEIKWFWSAVVHGKPLCGCGSPVKECPFWSQIISDLEGQGIKINEVEELFSKFSGTTQIPAINLRRKSGIGLTDWQKFVQATKALYTSVATYAPGKIIVDGSKLPPQLLVLQDIPEFDLRVIHLIRDGRGVAYSWDKRWQSRPGTIFTKYRIIRWWPYVAILVWVIQNVLILRLLKNKRYQIVLHYGDFIISPEQELEKILAQLDIKAYIHFLKTGEQITLPPTHSIGGSGQVRFTNPTRTLKVDDEWQQKMSPTKKFVLNVLSYPILRYFGYIH